MATEGSHDSNIYLGSDASITSFSITGSNTPTRNISYTLISPRFWSGYSQGQNYYNCIEFVESYEQFTNSWLFRIKDTGNGSVISAIVLNSGADAINFDYPWQLTGNDGLFNGSSMGFFDEFIGGTPFIKLDSIQNVAFTHDVQETNSQVVGKGLGTHFIEGPTVVTASIDKVLNKQDIIC